MVIFLLVIATQTEAGIELEKPEELIEPLPIEVPVIQKEPDPEPKPIWYYSFSSFIEVMEPELAPLPDRTNCEDITGKPYRSPTEREFYLAECVVPIQVVEPTIKEEERVVFQQPVVVSSSQIQEDFIAGARAAGATDAVLAHLMRMIPCESGWNPMAYNPVGPFYGLLQFLESTWNTVGGGDIYDPWQQGHNGATLYQIADWRSQWPVCGYA